MTEKYSNGKCDVVLFEANGAVESLSPTVRQCGIPALGLKALEAFLEQNGYKTKVIMQGNKSTYDFFKEIKSYNPLVVGASSNTCEYSLTCEIMNSLKKTNPNILTVVGGYHVSSYPEAINPDVARRHYANPQGIDLLVLGEGEQTMLDIVRITKKPQKSILNYILAHKYLTETKGIAYWDGSKVIKTAPRERILDLDLLPNINWSEEDLLQNSFNGMINYRDDKKGGVVAVVSERGCPYSCSFCSTFTTYGPKVSTKTIEKFVDEIEFLVRDKGVNTVVDYAPTPNRDAKRIIAFTQEIKKRGLEKTFSMYSPWRLESPNGKLMITEEIVKNLTDVLTGMKRGIGIEALHEKDQDYLNKKHSLQNITKTSEYFDKYGALLRGFFMITPSTTNKAVEECTNSYLLSLFDDLRITYLTPFPGTSINNKISEDDFLTQNWASFNCEQPIIRSNMMNEEELKESKIKILQGFLLNPLRQKRIKEKLLKHTHLKTAYAEYTENMKNFGFKTLQY